MKILLNSASQPERPRERLLTHGAKVLSTAELLAVIIGTAPKGSTVVNFCSDLLSHFGSLQSLLNTPSEELHAIKGLGSAKICQLLALQEIAIRTLEEPLRKYSVLGQSTIVKQYCINQLGNLPIEYCYALFLDNSFKLIHTQEISKGTIDKASVYPREIVRAALRYHAVFVILTHNHPSGSLEPSPADIELTHVLKKALSTVDIKLIDHLIVAKEKAVSLAEIGYLN